MPPRVSEQQPAKKQSKWTPEEDVLIIELRGRGLKWEDISKQLPGRSAISCRLHYQNYLERRSEWSEERKDKLAQLYERFKSDMWAKVAEELAVPWRAAEAMHWQLGEADMAKRAGVVPFSLAAVNAESSSNRRSSPQRHHHGRSHSQSHSTPHSPSHPHMHGGVRPGIGTAPARIMYARASNRPMGQTQTHNHHTPRRETFVPQPSPLIEEHSESVYGRRTHLAPIQTMAYPTGGRSLPSISEMTTGMAPYDGGVMGHTQNAGAPTNSTVTHHHNAFVPAPPTYAVYSSPRLKRRASPEDGHREAIHRRRIS